MTKNIIKLLLEKNILFSVVSCLNELKNEDIDCNSKDYFITIYKEDFIELKKYCIKLNSLINKELNNKKNKNYLPFTNKYDKNVIENNRYNIVEINIFNKNYLEFRKNISLFVKVLHTKHGRVYELKNKSFKKINMNDCEVIKGEKEYIINVNNNIFKVENEIKEFTFMKCIVLKQELKYMKHKNFNLSKDEYTKILENTL